jgi:hypothetical protein
VADSLLGRIRHCAVFVAVKIDLNPPNELLTLGAYGKGLVPQHSAHPRKRLRWWIDAHPSDEDLDGALVRVVRIIGAMREAPREPQQLRGMLLHEP